MKLTEKQYLKLVRITLILTSKYKNLDGINLLSKSEFDKLQDKSGIDNCVKPKDPHVALVAYKIKKRIVRVACSSKKDTVDALMKCLNYLYNAACEMHDKKSIVILGIVDYLHDLLIAPCGYAYLVKFGHVHNGIFDYGVSRVPYPTRKQAAVEAVRLASELGRIYNKSKKPFKVTPKDFETGCMIKCPLSREGNGFQVEILAYAVFPEKYGV